MSHSHRSSRSERHGHRSHASKSSGSFKPSGSYPCRFIFTVTELSYADNATPYYDSLNNQLPPQDFTDFGPRIPGKILRYNNGDVSVAPGFAAVPGRPYYDADNENDWRPSTIGYYTDTILNNEGQVMRLTERTWMPLQSYSTTTMYNCSPFAPCLFKPGDASDPNDPMARDYGDFRMMHFTNEGGVSRASANGGIRKVAGNNPTWVGSLVPDAYNDRKTGQVSTGLGGEFSLLIALMALAQARGHCDRAFTEQKWLNNRWTGRRNPIGWPNDDEEPRGVVVEIAYEKASDNGTMPPGSSWEDIQTVEWSGIAVRES
ncbi:hypothetical protein PG996_015561 [Apiospora saccharicola]|uniref:Uncharacterized protein n=1 Tax=Apiospora saccharicola TaxID=335842 RepID=A0ABR1TM74_9PEZI